MRFLLACGVILVHTGGYVPINGNMGVQCFYILSGFFMCLILNEKYTGKGGNLRFYSYRALKIYPIYWLALSLSIIWSVIVYKLGYPGVLTHYANHWPLPFLTIAFFVITNVFLVGLDSIFFLGLNKNGQLYPTGDFNHTEPHVYSFAFNSIAWTIGIELLFYLMSPFILRRKLWVISTLLILSLLTRILLTHYGYTGAQWNYMFFPTQLMFFMAGALSYHLFNFLRTKKIPQYVVLILYSLYAALVLSYNSIMPEGLFKESFLFICTVLFIPIGFGITVQSKVDRYLGELSYPIYVSQALVLMAMHSNRFPKIFSPWFTACLLCIGFALFSHHFITKPISKWNRARSEQRRKAVTQLRPVLEPNPI